MDIDGDGRPEVITTLYNDAADGKWHLTFIDGLTGVAKADFHDEMLAARWRRRERIINNVYP